MEVLGALGIFDIVRAAAFSVMVLFLPGYLFVRIDGLKKIGQHPHAQEADGGKLFEGILEVFAASLFFSVIISSLAFIALAFTIGLNAYSAFLGILAIIAIEAYFVWKERH